MSAPFTAYGDQRRIRGGTATSLLWAGLDTDFSDKSVWGYWFWPKDPARVQNSGKYPFVSTWALQAKKKSGSAPFAVLANISFADKNTDEASVWLPWFIFQDYVSASTTVTLGSLTGVSTGTTNTNAALTITLQDVTSATIVTIVNAANLSLTLADATISAIAAGYTPGDLTITLGSLRCSSIATKGPTPVTRDYSTVGYTTQITQAGTMI